MELTEREKEILVMFGSFRRKDTHFRLAKACTIITDPVRKSVACGLRNKLYEMNDRTYTKLYCRTLEEWNTYSGDAA